MSAGLTFEEERPLRQVIGWPASEPPHETPLVERCHAALDLPLKDQTVETLRLLLGQGIGVETLLPRALDILELDILASGDLYDGDLLQSCLRLPASTWSQNPTLWTQLNAILSDFDRKVAQVNSDRAVFCQNNPFGARL